MLREHKWEGEVSRVQHRSGHIQRGGESQATRIVPKKTKGGDFTIDSIRVIKYSLYIVAGVIKYSRFLLN